MCVCVFVYEEGPGAQLLVMTNLFLSPGLALPCGL